MSIDKKRSRATPDQSQTNSAA